MKEGVFMPIKINHELAARTELEQDIVALENFSGAKRDPAAELFSADAMLANISFAERVGLLDSICSRAYRKRIQDVRGELIRMGGESTPGAPLQNPHGCAAHPDGFDSRRDIITRERELSAAVSKIPDRARGQRPRAPEASEKPDTSRAK